MRCVYLLCDAANARGVGASRKGVEECAGALARSFVLPTLRQELYGQRFTFLAENAAGKFRACDFQRGERARHVAATQCFARIPEHASLLAQATAAFDGLRIVGRLLQVECGYRWPRGRR
jgi:hypothetical protein